MNRRSLLERLLDEALTSLEEAPPSARAPLITQARALSKELHELDLEEAAAAAESATSSPDNVTPLDAFRSELGRRRG